MNGSPGGDGVSESAKRFFAWFFGLILALLALVSLHSNVVLSLVAGAFSVLLIPRLRPWVNSTFPFLRIQRARDYAMVLLFVALLVSSAVFGPTRESDSRGGSISGAADLAQESEAKCRSFVENYGIGRIGKQKSRRDDEFCEVFDKVHLKSSEVYIESLQVSVTFMGDGSVVFGNFHHPEMPSAFQQDQGFQELWDKALSAAGFVNIPRISDVSALYMRIGNTGKVTSHSIDFGAKDCFGNYLVDLWISDLTPFTQRAGSPPKIQESIAVEKCNPAKIRDVNPAHKGTPAPEAEVQRTTEATRPAERFSTNPDGTISDSQSGIVWTAEDSGIGLSWNDAQDYCAAKGAGWQLPTVDQLSAIYDESMPLVSCGFVQSTAVSCAVSGRFKLSGPRLWTNKPHEPAQAWYVNLWGGGSGTDHIRPSTVIPALCVRVP